MPKITLYDYQMDAVRRMKNGCILCGGVGSGKSRTALAYYYLENGGLIGEQADRKMVSSPRDLYIITTARKRDTMEWEAELPLYLMSTNPDCTPYKHSIVIDSWNNIKKYKDVFGAFFIFDEDRVTGSGVWVKSFLKIARKNKWIILSATPGDKWSDYIPVFVANGFYRSKTEFCTEHVVWSRFTQYPKIDRYLETSKLIRLRKWILVEMDFKRPTKSHHEDVFASYNVEAYKDIMRNRWDIWNNKPIKNAAELCYALRKVVNADESRQKALLEIIENHPRVIIFYNFNYERDILKNICYGDDFQIAEWNGWAHEPVPEGKQWVYLVQYCAGAEGWNCIKTDTIVFYSQNYSYKTMLQSAGRIDRLNSPYLDLYYYHIRSRSGIDLAIAKALGEKKTFNESAFTKWKGN